MANKNAEGNPSWPTELRVYYLNTRFTVVGELVQGDSVVDTVKNYLVMATKPTVTLYKNRLSGEIKAKQEEPLRAFVFAFNQGALLTGPMTINLEDTVAQAEVKRKDIERAFQRYTSE